MDEKMQQEHLLKPERMAALIDGIFAIAMTILVLDLRLPEGTTTANVAAMLTTEVMHRLVIYIGSFIILGTLWIAMNFQYGLVERVNRTYFWANVLYLMAICVVPFSASIVASYRDSVACISFYAINLLFAQLGQYLIFRCAIHFKLNNSKYTPEIHRAIVRRILVAPILYCASLVFAQWDERAAFFLLIVPPLLYMIPGKVDHFDH
jgi:uncharacterized membrane protein